MRIALKKLLPAFILCFIFCFMLFIYEPILLYVTNINDFWFDFNIMFKPVIAMFFLILLIGILAITFGYLIFTKLLKKESWYYAILLIIFLIFFITYIQGNYLISNLPNLDGSVINWNIYHKENYITLGIFLILIIISLLAIKKFKLEKTIQYSMYISIAIFVMLCTSLISTLVTNEKVFMAKNSLAPTFANINTASKNKNFYIVLLDAIDSDVFYKEWQSDENYQDLLNDFTYYNNALAYYPFTRDSIPLILTGKINHNEKEFSEYSTDAYNNSPLFKNLIKQNYNINLYDTDIIWNGEKNINIGNNSTDESYKIDTIKFFKQELKYILFKYLPYSLKKFSSIESFDFNICFNRYNLYLTIGNNVIVNNPKLELTDKNEFKYIHLEGGHVPFDIDENINRIENGTYEQKVHGNLKYIKSFLERLKNNGVYDNSVIVIMADHGYDETEKGSILDRMNPLFIVKGINESHEVKISDKAISFADINEVFINLLNGQKSTELFKDIQNNKIRTTIWYKYNKENHMVEYETKGRANEIDKFKKTGRVFDR